MRIEAVIGGIAAALGVSISLPQIWKTYKTKEVSGVAVSMWALLFVMQICWIIYATMREDYILLVANCVAFVQTVVMLGLIKHYSR